MHRPFYSGKHRRPGMNLQVIANPDGDIVLVSGLLPGTVHDLTAARIWGVVRELADSGLVVLGDKGYLGEDDIRTPIASGTSLPRRRRPTGRMPGSALRASAHTNPDASCANSTAAPGAPGCWRERYTFFRPAKSKDEKGWMLLGQRSVVASFRHCSWHLVGPGSTGCWLPWTAKCFREA